MRATATAHQVRKFTLHANDVVITKDSEDLTDIGVPAYVPSRLEGVICGYHLAIIRPSRMVKGKFLRYLFESESASNYFAVTARGLTRVGLSQEALNNQIVAWPPLQEQAAIAQFLDSQTARIDALIQEQQRLIELLEEKRQAVISHAVTKGLDPDVPMKDSGVEWLGQVPAHWTVLTLRRITRDIEQGWSPDCFSYPANRDEWGVLTAGAVNNGVYRSEANKALPDSENPVPTLEVQPGDVIMCRASGSVELIGSVAYVDKTRSRLMLSDKLFRLIFVDVADPQYIAMALDSLSIRRQIELSISGAEGLANNLPIQKVKSISLALPPRNEQKTIQQSVSCTVETQDRLIAQSKKSKRLLEERRVALISSAVTGDIDVRNWHAQRIEKECSAGVEGMSVWPTVAAFPSS
jgi:type I restriction enzyme S subunit